MSHHADDRLDDLLARGQPAADALLRRRLLIETTQVLRQRQRRRRIAFALALAAGVLLLLGGVAWLRPRPGLPTPPPPRGEHVAEAPTAPLPLAADTPAAVIERIGETSAPDQRADLYRRAGDRYLEEASDADAALRCYTQALDDGSDADLTVSTDDSWLLMALKLDRQKEKRNANRN